MLTTQKPNSIEARETIASYMISQKLTNMYLGSAPLKLIRSYACFPKLRLKTIDYQKKIQHILSKSIESHTCTIKTHENLRSKYTERERERGETERAREREREKP